jgi:membrane fusion protein, multidrug efflux system
MKQAGIQAIVAYAALAAALLGCGAEEEKAKETPRDEGTPVDTIVAVGETFVDRLEVVAVVKAKNEANVGTPRGGKVARVYAKEGSRVGRGAIIAAMDRDALKAALDIAEADYRLAEATFEKRQKVYADSVVSELAFLQAEASRDRAKANYEMAKANYEDALVRAPFAGYVEDVFFEPGEIAPPSATVARVVDASTVVVEGGASEEYVGAIAKGDEVVVGFSILPAQTYRTTLTFVGKTVNESNRTFRIEAEVPNREGALKPEMNARLSIALDESENVVVIPEDAILTTEAGEVVYVYADGVAELRVVTVGSRHEGRASILAGLEPGDAIVVEGYHGLVDGQRVRIAE